MPEWTPANVEDRLRKAIALKARLIESASDPAPGEGMGIIGGIGVTETDAAGDDVVVAAVEALSWLRWLEPDDAEIVLARIEAAPWKLICWRFGISRPTADRRWRYAIALIAWRLNGHTASGPLPSLRSMLNRRAA